jgi:hypothetical protein
MCETLEFLFSPGIGYMISSNSIGVKAYFEYLELKIKDMTPLRFNVSFFINFD